MSAGRTKRTFKKYIFIYSMLLITILHFAIFYIYLNFNSIRLAFIDQTTETFTFGNFQMFFNDLKMGSDSSILRGLLNTLKYYASGLLIILPLSAFFSCFLYKKILLHRFLKIVFLLPMIISPVVYTAVFKTMVSNNGIVQQVYTFFTGNAAPQFLYNAKYATNTIVAYTIWTGMGLNVIMLSGALIRIPESIVEAGKLDGIGFFKEMFSVALPLIWPTFSVLFLTQAVSILMASGPILLFTKGRYDTMTLNYWLYDRVIENGVYNYASAYGIIFTLLSMPVFVISRLLIRVVPSDIEF